LNREDSFQRPLKEAMKGIVAVSLILAGSAAAQESLDAIALKDGSALL
jgi:hypothetical protein